MHGYTEHRTTTNGRLDLEKIKFSNHSTEVCISARENSRKDRGVDIRIFLNADDLIEAVRILAGENNLLRLRIKAELAAIDYHAALQQAAENKNEDG